MPVRSPIKAFAAIAIGIALATALGGCALLPFLAPAPTPTGESVSAACDALESEVEEVKSEMQQAAEILNTKTGAAAELLSVAAFRLNFMAEEEIQNEEVIEVTTGVSESITALSDLLKEAAADPDNADADAIDTAGDDVNAAFDAFEEVRPTPVEPVSAECDPLLAELGAVSAEMHEADQLLATDTTGAAEILTGAAVRLEEATAAVEDEKLSEVATTASESVTLLSDLITQAAADPDNADTAALDAAGNDVNEALLALVTFCTSDD